MKKFYYYMYHRVYHFAINISDDALNEIKPGATLCMLECALIGEIIIWLQAFNLVSQKTLNILWSTPIIAFIVVIICLFNYYYFLRNQKWKKYQKEFNAYGKKKRLLNDLLVLAIIVFVILSLFFSLFVLYRQ